MRFAAGVSSLAVCLVLACVSPFESGNHDDWRLNQKGSVQALWTSPDNAVPGQTVEIHVRVDPGPYVFIDGPYVKFTVSGGVLRVPDTPVQDAMEGAEVWAPARYIVPWQLPEELGSYTLIATYDGDSRDLVVDVR